ncbi:MAG: hypothetical protein P4L83_04960 [Nevskia sp.]|nr:hypothetical protein [Nevskia sp.]
MRNPRSHFLLQRRTTGYAKAEATGSGDFQSLWDGQAAALGRELPAAELTRRLADAALARLRR